MRIGIIAVSLLSGGGVNNFLNEIEAVMALDKTNDYYVFLSREQADMASRLPGRASIVFVYLPSNVFLRTLATQVMLPWCVRKNKIDMLYCLGNISLLFSGIKSVVLVQNANPFSRVRKWSRSFRIKLFLNSVLTLLYAKRSDRVVYVSQNSKKLFDRLMGLDGKKSRVV
ncbi:MAG: hypothetical protein ABIJ26_01955, partial [Candidatus Margulisiibacteriota bacterium]